jgi:carnitine 3-dehydrogenase
MTESRYLQVFGETTDALLARIGADGPYVAGGHSYYTVETHIRHLDEAKLGESWHATTQILAADDKRYRVFHRLHGTAGTLLATAEQMLVHVDMAAGRACPAAPDVLDRLRPLADAHAGLAWPDVAGRGIGAR